jgi:hypothetical protein
MMRVLMGSLRVEDCILEGGEGESFVDIDDVGEEGSRNIFLSITLSIRLSSLSTWPKEHNNNISC